MSIPEVDGGVTSMVQWYGLQQMTSCRFDRHEQSGRGFRAEVTSEVQCRGQPVRHSRQQSATNAVGLIDASNDVISTGTHTFCAVLNPAQQKSQLLQIYTHLSQT